jgi:tape measure domain-containing protein
MTAAEVEVIVRAQMGSFMSDMKKARKEVKDLADNAGKGAREVGTGTERILSHVSSMAKSIAVSAGSSLVAMKLFQFGRDAVKAAASMDSLKRGLTAIMGSSKRAADEMERLREVAKLPGLGFRDAIEGSTRLQATGLSAKQARDALMGFGNALATVGKGKADLDGVTLALGQIMSKGKVSAEEINQIAERVPQIRQVMKDAFGTADTEILQKAKITSEQFVDVVTKSLLKIPKVTGGIGNDLENVSDQIDKAMTTAGESVLPLVSNILDKGVPALESLIGWFKALSPSTKDWILSATVALAVAVPLASGFNAIAGAIGTVTAMRLMA